MTLQHRPSILIYRGAPRTSFQGEGAEDSSLSHHCLGTASGHAFTYDILKFLKGEA